MGLSERFVLIEATSCRISSMAVCTYMIEIVPESERSDNFVFLSMTSLICTAFKADLTHFS